MCPILIFFTSRDRLCLKQWALIRGWVDACEHFWPLLFPGKQWKLLPAHSSSTQPLLLSFTCCTGPRDEFTWELTDPLSFALSNTFKGLLSVSFPLHLYLFTLVFQLIIISLSHHICIWLWWHTGGKTVQINQESLFTQGAALFLHKKTKQVFLENLEVHFNRSHLNLRTKDWLLSMTENKWKENF